MTDEEFHAKMFPRARDHKHDCEWHHDQYWFECTCGLIPVMELVREVTRRRASSPAQHHDAPAD